MSADNSQGSALGRLFNALSSSAEYAISLALLLVCLVVGVVIWLSGDKPDSEASDAASSLAAAMNAPAVVEDDALDQAALEAEREALEALQRQLRDSMQEVEARGREQAELLEQQRLEEEERLAREAKIERQRQEAEARLAALKAELAERERLQAERARRAAENAKSQRASSSQPAKITAASIDWNSCKQPEYPRASRVAGEEGDVILSLKIDASGTVTDGEVSQSSGSRRLDRATLQALKKCRFEPATQNDVAVASTGTLRFTWSLR